MRIVVTGGSGFIGTSMFRRLKGKHDFVNLDVVEPKEDHGAEFIKCDIRDYESLKGVFTEKIRKADAVIHLAALSRERDSNERKDEYFAVNIDGTFNVLKATNDIGCKKFFFASSYLVYGNTTRIPVNEDRSLMPESIYAASKAIGESLCSSFSKIHDMTTICFRQCLAYGPKDFERRVVTLFIEKARAGQDLTVFGDKTLDLVHVDDIVDAYDKALDYGKSGYFNIGSGRGVTLKEIAENVQSKINPKIKIDYKPSNKGEVNIFIADISKAGKEFGYHPNGSLEKFIASEAE